MARARLYSNWETMTKPYHTLPSQAINSSDSGLLVVASKNKQFALDALKNAVNDVQ